MKYLSIDIETTGLYSDKNQMVEFGAVVEDLASTKPVEELPTFQAIIMQEDGEYRISPFVMKMHEELFATIGAADRTRLQDAGFYQAEKHTEHNQVYYCYAKELQRLFQQWVIKHDVQGKITPAGKNFYGFDHGFIKPVMPDVKFHHRCLDPIMYYIKTTDSKPPNLQLCCERAGISMAGYHTAVGDARMVIELIRIGMKRCGLV